MQYQPMMGDFGAGGGDGRSQRADPTPQIFIGKIPPGVPVGILEAQLVPFGANNVRMLEGKGCAFANFDSWAAAERAIVSLNGLKLVESAAEGINVKLADQKGAPKGREGKPKVFIGGLVPGLTEDAIYQVCSNFGSITEAKILAKNPSAPPCAFVTFATFTEAELCISSMHGQEHEIGTPGKTLNVRFADSQQNKGGSIIGGAIVGGGGCGGGCGGSRVGMASHRGAMGPSGAMMAAAMSGGGHMQHQPSAGGARHHQVGMGGGGGGGMMAHGAVSGHQGGRPSPGGGPPPAGASQKIFIGNLPEAASEDFVWGMMAPFGEVVEAKMHRKPGAAPCGFVRFATPAEADVAVTTLSSQGRYTIKFADDRGAKRTHQAAFDPSGMQGYADPTMGGWGGEIHPQGW